MNEQILTPWARLLARQVNSEHEFVRAALHETYVHAINAGKLLLDALGQIPPLTGSDWITAQTKLSVVEARALVCLARGAPLLDELDVRIASLNARQYVDFRRARDEASAAQLASLGQ